MIKKVLPILGFVLLIIIAYQFYIIEFDRSSYTELRQKAITDLKAENIDFNDKIVEDVTKAYWTKESEEKLRAVKLRRFADSLSSEDKRLLLQHLKYQTLEENPSKIFEIKTIKKGYTFRTYVNEKIFGLTSIRQVNFSKNYFIIIISTFGIIVLIILWLTLKRKTNE
tara:strand:- start:259 stop:762 length:504 start_codon:yes stop_codon:yes gene_type:complete